MPDLWWVLILFTFLLAIYSHFYIFIVIFKLNLSFLYMSSLFLISKCPVANVHEYSCQEYLNILLLNCNDNIIAYTKWPWYILTLLITHMCIYNTQQTEYFFLLFYIAIGVWEGIFLKTIKAEYEIKRISVTN
jgi:hypothetical protein